MCYVCVGKRYMLCIMGVWIGWVMCMRVHHHFCPLRVQKWENVENVKTSKNIIAIRVNTFIAREKAGRYFAYNQLNLNNHGTK